MKKLIQQTLLLFLLTAISCERDNVDPTNSIKVVAKTKISSLKNEPYLKDILDKIGFIEAKNGRVNNSGTSLYTDSLLMALQADSVSYSYTLKVKGNLKNGSFTNLIFKRVVGGVKGFYLKYEPDASTAFNLSKFTGQVTSYDLNWREISSQKFINGSIISNKGGRIQCAPNVSTSKECLTEDGKSRTTGTNLPCFYGTVIIIDLDYSGCLITNDVGPGGGLPTQYTRWSDGTFVPSQYFNFNSSGGGPSGSGSGTSCGGDGISTPSGGADPNSCSDVIGVYPPSEEELLRFLTDALITDLTNESLLDVQQNDKLKEAFNDVYKKCPNKVLIEALHQNGFKFKFKIDGNLTTPGGFDPVTNSIKFRSTNDINFETLQEELFHAYQHLSVSILTQMTSPYLGRSNIEFESKVYHDVICYVTNSFPCALWGNDSDEYSTWIKEITSEWTKYPTWEKMQGKYYKLLEDFVRYNPNYNFPIDYNLKPAAIFKATNGC